MTQHQKLLAYYQYGYRKDRERVFKKLVDSEAMLESKIELPPIPKDTVVKKEKWEKAGRWGLLSSIML